VVVYKLPLRPLFEDLALMLRRKRVVFIRSELADLIKYYIVNRMFGITDKYPPKHSDVNQVVEFLNEEFSIVTKEIEKIDVAEILFDGKYLFIVKGKPW